MSAASASSVPPVRVTAEVRARIEELVHEHAWLIDHGRAAEVVELYAEDARIKGIGADKVGRAEIAAWAQQRAAMHERRSRHSQTNIRLDTLASDRIAGTVLLTLYRHDGEGPGSATPLLVGEYTDVYVMHADGRWRFQDRDLAILFGSV